MSSSNPTTARSRLDNYVSKLPDYLKNNDPFVNHLGRTFQKEKNGKCLVPNCWNYKDRCSLLELSKDSLGAKYTGAGKGDNDIAAVRANHPIPPQVGVFYYEIEIVDKGQKGFIGIGFCTQSVSLNRLPGWELQSWGYHGDDGHSFCCSGIGKPYGPTFTTGDVIGCGINFRDNTAFFTKNGIHLGVAFTDIKGVFYPAIGLRTPNEEIEANFGSRKFKFDISQYFEEEKIKLWNNINSISITSENLCSNFSGDSTTTDHNQINEESSTLKTEKTDEIIKLMVVSYLVHHGYTKSAKKFVENSAMHNEYENKTLFISETENKIRNRIKEELDAEKEADNMLRKEIRDLVTNGDIDSALKILSQNYPKVLSQNREIKFKLDCQKFVEMYTRTDFESSNDKEEQSGSNSPTGNNRKRSRNEDQEIESLKLGQLQKFGHYMYSFYNEEEDAKRQEILTELFSLIAFKNMSECSASCFLEKEKREELAIELNRAILISQNRPPIPSIETVIRQCINCSKEMLESGLGCGAFIDIKKDCI